MATFFGEVIFNAGRAYDEFEDDEDEDVPRERYDIEVPLTSDKKIKCSKLIVSYGTLANEFIDGCLRPEFDLIGEILFRKREVESSESVDFHPRNLRSSQLHFSPDGVLYCKSSPDLIPKMAGKFSEYLLSLITDSCPVLVLCSYHSSKLNSRIEENINCSCYNLASPSFTHRASFSPLPQPSVLDSVPAAMMTECVMHDRPCLVYAAFTDTVSSGNVDLLAEEFSEAASAEPFKETLTYSRRKFRSCSKSEMFDRYM